ncbi:hypothetical protein ASE74_07755 [Pedobacter sp. Leaf216]|nr:hypothetical protein ASE74_07755 [Pedobacter sp. Leaf216]
MDTDGDGIANNIDQDDDNDGILDAIENTCSLPPFSTSINPQLFWDLNSTPFPGSLEKNLFAPDVITSSSSVSFGGGFASSTNGYLWTFNNATATTSAQAISNNQYIQVTIPMASTANRVYELKDWITYYALNQLQNVKIVISTSPAFTTNTVLYDGTVPTFSAGEGFYKTSLTKNFRLLYGNTYYVRVYLYGNKSAFNFDSFSFNGVCYTDTDGDGIPDLEDTDSDNDGCSDANEYYNDKTKSGSDNRYGDASSRTVDANGRVIGATYTSTKYNNVITRGGMVAINTQPVKKIVNVGDNISYTVGAITSAGNLSYQWQVLTTATGSIWTDITNAGGYNGASTATLSITNATKAMNIYQYRVKIINDNNVCQEAVSDAALLDVKPQAINDNVCYTPHINQTVPVLSNDNVGDTPNPTTVVIKDPVTSIFSNAITVTGQGSWEVNNTTGNITFKPQAGYNGNPSITYKMMDNEGNSSNEATVTLTGTTAPAVIVQGSPHSAVF